MDNYYIHRIYKIYTFVFMKMIIELPDEVHEKLMKLAQKELRKTKPYAEMVIIKHVERRSNPKK